MGRLLAVVVLLTASCSRPRAPAEEGPLQVSLGDGGSSAAAGEPAPSPVASGEAPTSGRCSRDEDCKLHSFYCESCQCLALAKEQPEPTCRGRAVNCLLDPCQHRRAACDHGKCVLPEAR